MSGEKQQNLIKIGTVDFATICKTVNAIEIKEQWEMMVLGVSSSAVLGTVDSLHSLIVVVLA